MSSFCVLSKTPDQFCVTQKSKFEGKSLLVSGVKLQTFYLKQEATAMNAGEHQILPRWILLMGSIMLQSHDNAFILFD